MRLVNPDFHKNINKEQCLCRKAELRFHNFYDYNQLCIKSETRFVVFSSCLGLYKKLFSVFDFVTLNLFMMSCCLLMSHIFLSVPPLAYIVCCLT